MKANVTNLKDNLTKGNWRDTKELVHSHILIDTVNKKTLVTVRTYMGRSKSSSTVYSLLWVSSSKTNNFGSGQGQAGGYGYHKQSASIADAIHCAGIILDQNISGAGESSEKEAIIAIGVALGYNENDLYLVEAYA